MLGEYVVDSIGVNFAWVDNGNVVPVRPFATLKDLLEVDAVGITLGLEVCEERAHRNLGNIEGVVHEPTRR